jgi:uncharacterized membrane protein YedE/YeeE
MENVRQTVHWKSYAVISLVAMAVVIALSIYLQLPVLTAVPIGFLFGFFLERSDLCGASAFSEVVVMRDWRKFFGIWIVIIVSMCAFALGNGLGLISLNPKPLYWANTLVGGTIFGVGIVLAGGCISGVLFKAGQGNINSMAGLVAIPVGIAAVLYGPLRGPNQLLHTKEVRTLNGEVPTLSTVTGIPYWLLALIFAAVTLLLIFFFSRRRPTSARSNPKPKTTLSRPWKPWQSGVAIGLLSLFAYMSSAQSGRNYPFGTAEGVVGLAVMVVDTPGEIVWQKPQAPASNSVVIKSPAPTTQDPPKRVVLWMVILVIMLLAGSHLSARLRGSFRLVAKPPDEMIVAFLGGMIVGVGATIGAGCVVGHIMSGVAMLSVSSILFFGTVVLANWVTTYLYLMGGQSIKQRVVKE